MRDLAQLNESYKALQHENYQLRDYIISLQSRLIDTQGEYPQPPSDIDLTHPTPSSSSSSNPPRPSPPRSTAVAKTPTVPTTTAPPSHTARQAPPSSSDPSSRAPTAPMRNFLHEDLQASAAKAMAETNHRKEEASRYGDRIRPIRDSPLFSAPVFSTTFQSKPTKHSQTSTRRANDDESMHRNRMSINESKSIMA